MNNTICALDSATTDDVAAVSSCPTNLVNAGPTCLGKPYFTSIAATRPAASTQKSITLLPPAPTNTLPCCIATRSPHHNP